MTKEAKTYVVYDLLKNEEVTYTLEQIIDTIHDAGDMENVLSFNINGKSELVGVDITNASGNVFAKQVLEKQKAAAYYHKSDNFTQNAKSGILQQSYVLIYELSEAVTRGEAQSIEDEIIHEIKQENKDIDLHGGELIGFHSEGYKINGTTDNPGFAELVLNDSVQINVGEFKNKRDKEQDFKELQEMMNKRMNKSPYKVFEFIKMAEFLNNKKVYLDGHDEITKSDIIEGVFNSVYHKEYMEETALEIIRKADKEALSNAEYLDMKPKKGTSGKSIGTFIYYSREMGYKRPAADAKAAGRIDGEDNNKNEEVIEIDDFIPIDYMYNFIKDDSRRAIMIESPTGSGKTYSVGKALKQYTSENEHTFAIIASPTIPLVLQTALTAKIGEGLYGKVSVNKVIKDSIKRGDRTISTTYDRADQVVDAIKSMYTHEEYRPRFVIVVDEAHKEFSDADYRLPAITRLFNLRDNDYLVEKFIGLSGTTAPIPANTYEHPVKFVQTDADEVFEDLIFVKYNKSKEYEDVVIAAIKDELREGNRVLTFIQSRKTIDRIQNALRKEGINVASIKAQKGNENRSETYKYVVENKAFPEGIDVVLSTTVISDGVSINNKTGNYTTILAAHYAKSKMFDPSLNKQMSHRLRTRFKKVIVPLLFPTGMDEERIENDVIFNVDSHFEWLLFNAKNYASFTRERFKDNLDLYKPSVLEVANGLHGTNKIIEDDYTSEHEFFKYAIELERHLKANPLRYPSASEADALYALNKRREELFTADARKIRRKSLDDADEYYSYYPNAYIHVLEQILEKEGKIVSAYEYLESFNDESLKKTRKTLQKMTEEEKEEDEEKARNLEVILTEDKYKHMRNIYFKYGKKLPLNHEAVADLHDAMSVRNFKVLKEIVAFVIERDHAVSIIKTIKRDSDIRLLNRRLDAVDTVNTYLTGGKLKATATQIVLETMTELFEEANYIDHKGLKCLMNNQIEDIKRKTKGRFKLEDKEGNASVSMREINSIYNKFYMSEKTGTVRIEGRAMKLRYAFRLVNLKDVGYEFGLSREAMQSIYEIYKVD